MVFHDRGSDAGVEMSESTRQHLISREDIANEDIDDIIGLASELHELQRRADSGPSIEEIKAVAGELDIDPAFIEQAIVRLQELRHEEDLQNVAFDLRKKERTKLGAIVVTTLLGIASIALGTQVYLAKHAAVNMQTSIKNVENAAGYVELVLDRQVALVPQLIAVSGGDPTPLEARISEMQAAESLPARLEVSQSLNVELSRLLSELPPVENDTEAIQRLGLTHELTGIQNRLATERDKLLRACGHWEREVTNFETKWTWIVALGIVEVVEPEAC